MSNSELKIFKELISQLVQESLNEIDTSWTDWKNSVDTEFKKRNPKAIPGTADYARMNMAAKKYTDSPNRPSPQEFLQGLGVNTSTQGHTDPHMPTYPGTFDGQVFTANMGFDTKQFFFPMKQRDEETGEETTKRIPRFVDQQVTRSYVWDAQAKKWLRGTKLPRNPMPNPQPTPTTKTPAPAPLRGPRPQDKPTHEPKVIRRRPSN